MGNKSNSFAVLLHSNIPQELRDLLGEYLFRPSDHPFLACEEPNQDGYFLSVVAMKKGKKEPWPMRIPLQYVLAILDMSKDAPDKKYLISKRKDVEIAIVEALNFGRLVHSALQASNEIRRTQASQDRRRHR